MVNQKLQHELVPQRTPSIVNPPGKSHDLSFHLPNCNCQARYQAPHRRNNLAERPFQPGGLNRRFVNGVSERERQTSNFVRLLYFYCYHLYRVAFGEGFTAIVTFGASCAPIIIFIIIFLLLRNAPCKTDLPKKKKNKKKHLTCNPMSISQKQNKAKQKHNNNFIVHNCAQSRRRIVWPGHQDALLMGFPIYFFFY